MQTQLRTIVTRVVEAEPDDRSEIFGVLDCGLDKKKNGNMLIRLIITFFIVCEADL